MTILYKHKNMKDIAFEIIGVSADGKDTYVSWWNIASKTAFRMNLYEYITVKDWKEYSIYKTV